MNLTFIKTTKCPICGCDVVIRESVDTEYNSSKIRKHVMGGMWEHRQFACGYGISYCPNFRREEIEYDCLFDPEKLEIERKRDDAKNALYDVIEKLSVDDAYKARLKTAIQYV